MKDRTKNLATVIVSKMTNKGPQLGDEPELDHGPQEEMDEMDIAAEELLAAIESKNVSGIKESIMAMMEMCMAKEELDDSQSENSPYPEAEQEILNDYIPSRTSSTIKKALRHGVYSVYN